MHGGLVFHYARFPVFRPWIESVMIPGIYLGTSQPMVPQLLQQRHSLLCDCARIWYGAAVSNAWLFACGFIAYIKYLFPFQL